MFNPYQFNPLSLFRNLMAGRNPQDLYNDMINTNPQFKEFVENNKNKTIEDIALEYDIDLNLLKKFM